MMSVDAAYPSHGGIPSPNLRPWAMIEPSSAKKIVIAEAAAAGDQVEVDVVARRVVGHGKSGGHHDDCEDEDAAQRIGCAVGDADHPRRPLR